MGSALPEGFDPVEVPLAPLAAAATRQLVDELTDDAPLPGHVADAIARRSAGSPLFVTEMVAALRHGADLEALPDSVEALMSVQIDELASADRAVLRQASVLGARFSRESFVAALELREDDAEGVLERLQAFLVADGEGAVRFRHGLLRDAAYQGLSFRRRRALHLRVGESLERSAGEDVEPVAEQLTRHFYEAGAWEKALRYGLLAGSAAKRAYATVDAAALLEQAVEAGRSWRQARPEAVALAAEALGEARTTLGELERAREALRIARRRVSGDAVEYARLLRKEATVVHRLGALPRRRGGCCCRASPRSRRSTALRRRPSGRVSRRSSGSSRTGRGGRGRRSPGSSARSPTGRRSAPRRLWPTPSSGSTSPSTPSANRRARPTAHRRWRSTTSSVIWWQRAAC